MSFVGTTRLACPFSDVSRHVQWFWGLVPVKRKLCKMAVFSFPWTLDRPSFTAWLGHCPAGKWTWFCSSWCRRGMAGICINKEGFLFHQLDVILCKWIIDVIWSMFNILCHESCSETAAFLSDSECTSDWKVLVLFVHLALYLWWKYYSMLAWFTGVLLDLPGFSINGNDFACVCLWVYCYLRDTRTIFWHWDRVSTVRTAIWTSTAFDESSFGIITDNREIFQFSI